MRIRHWGAVILITAGVNVGLEAGNEPCENAGTLVEGINDLSGLPDDSTDELETDFLEYICFGAFCDPGPCILSQPFQWAEFTATCTQALSITTYASDGAVGPAPLVMSTCDCRLDPWGFSFCAIAGGCLFDSYPISFLTVPGKSYKFAIFGGDVAVIEPLEDLTHVCNRDYTWFGDYTGWFYDDVAAFVSCQSNCNSPTCGKCFDADEDGAVTLRDFAEFQNNAAW